VQADKKRFRRKDIRFEAAVFSDMMEYAVLFQPLCFFLTVSY